MKLSKRELVLITTALAVFYDEIKNPTTTMKEEVLELCKKLNREYYAIVGES